MRRIWITVRVLLVIALVGLWLPVGVQTQEDSDLVAEWHFDEGSGSVLHDSSKNGNDGVIHGATWVDGKYGTALEFDGKDDRVDLPNIGSYLSGEFTYVLWVKVRSFSYDGILLTKSEHARDVRLETGEDWTWLQQHGIVVCARALDVNKWYHLAAGWDGSQLFIYINGELMGTVLMNHSPDFLGGSWWIGGDARLNRYSDATIDDIRIYNRALNADEIKSHFELASTPPIPTTSTPAIRIISAPSTIQGGEDIEVTIGWENIPSNWKLIVSLEKSDTDKDRLADDVERTISGSGEAVFKLNVYQIDKTYNYAKVWACLRDENDNWANVLIETSITAHPAASPTSQIAATTAPTQKQDDGTTQMLILAGSAIIALLVIVLIAGKLRGKTPEPTKEDVPSKPPVAGALSDNVDVKTKLDYKGTTIIYKVKVENNTNEAISDVKFYPHVPDLFLLKENLKSIPLIEPKRSQTVTFEMRPTSECGICNVAGRVNYYDGASKNRKDIEFEAKSLSIICPVLHRKEITEDMWRELISNLIKAEETGKDIPIDGETLFRMVSRTIKDDMSMHMLEQETTKGEVFNAVARFYAEGVGGLKYMAQVEVIGGVKKSMLLLKAWAEKEDALTGFFYGIFDKIMMKIDVGGYTDEPIIKNYFFGNYAPGGRIIDQSDKTIQISTEKRKCPNCGIEVEGEQKFCLECGAKL